MVPLLSSAARMPLPGATRARAVAASSSVMWNPPLGSGPLQYPGEAAVGRVAQAARLPAEEADLDGQLGADEHRGLLFGAGPGPAAAEQDRAGLGERALGGDQRPQQLPDPPPGRRHQAVVDPAAEHQPARPARVGQADEQGPDLVVVGDEAADQERLALVVLGLEPVPGPAAGHIGALELL